MSDTEIRAGSICLAQSCSVIIAEINETGSTAGRLAGKQIVS